MKKLSDYKGEEAIELWARILDPFIVILGDKDIANKFRSKVPPIITAKEMASKYPKEVNEIMLAIDPEPVDGLTVVVQLFELLKEIGSNETIRSFFPSLAGEKKEETSSGSATENTEESET